MDFIESTQSEPDISDVIKMAGDEKSEIAQLY